MVHYYRAATCSVWILDRNGFIDFQFIQRMYKIPGFSAPDRVLDGFLAETIINFIAFTFNRPKFIMPGRFTFISEAIIVSNI